MRLISKTLLAIACCGAASVATANTLAGKLDTTFGTSKNGKAYYQLPDGMGNATYGLGFLQQDQKIILLGTGLGSSAAETRGAVLRVNNGATQASSQALDSTFAGTGQKVVIPANATSATLNGGFQEAYSKNIVSVGSATIDGTKRAMVVRLNPNGTFDASFGDSGFVTFSAGTTSELVDAKQQDDGKIIAVGHTVINGVSHIFTARFLSSGKQDSTYGTAGVAVHQISASALAATAKSIAVQPDGKLIVAGNYNPAAGSKVKPIIMRLTSVGAFDPSFDADDTINNNEGRVSLTLYSDSGDEFANSAIVLKNGSIAVAGQANRRGNDFAITRLTADGKLDTSFAESGVYTSGTTNTLGGAVSDWLTDIVEEPYSGKLVATGRGVSNDRACFYALRLTSTGAPDPTFNNSNGRIAACMSGNSDVPNSISHQANGNWLLVGVSGRTFSVARLADVDTDLDGILDSVDPDPYSGMSDLDGDGIPDAADNDRDGDGVPNGQDAFPDDPNEWQDTDSDGVGDNADNCPTIANADQYDYNNDGLGDACDPNVSVIDTDGDGVPDDDDAFPHDPNEWEDTDGDGIGDNADDDDDNDGIKDHDDAFPKDPNESTDSDGDGVGDNGDNCRFVANPQQVDTDGDGVGDLCDDFPLDNQRSGDKDGDGFDDLLEDNCPLIANPNQADLDGDGIGDACDDDIDGDGVPNGDDAFPLDPDESGDTDGDGIGNNKDNCPSDFNQGQEDMDGDGIGDICDTDTDGDGYLNVIDAFPNDPTEWMDTDGDSIGNNKDNCVGVPNTDQADLDSDGIGDACDNDIDGDGIPNDQDAFPLNPNESTDSDGDGIGDNADNCPLIANSDQADLDGDGLGDVCDDDIDGDGENNDTDLDPRDPNESKDSDGDGIGDNADNCPLVANPDQLDADADGIGDACDAYPTDRDLLGSLNGSGINAKLGDVLISADLNKDGRDEIIIGSPMANVRVLGTDGRTRVIAKAGSVIVYSPSNNKVLYSWVGEFKNDQFGKSVAVTHDVDGDGVNDIIIGSPMSDAFVYVDGKRKMLRKDTGKIEVRSGKNGQLIFDLYGKEAGEQFGYAVAGLADDYNKQPSSDGRYYAEIVVASPAANVQRVIDGKLTLLKKAGKVSVIDSSNWSIATEWKGETANGLFGSALLSGIGDVNGDGFEDILIGAPSTNGSIEGKPTLKSGAAYLYSINPNVPVLTIKGETAGDRLGSIFAIHSDMTGDGIPEIIAAMPLGSVVTGNKVLKQAGKAAIIDPATGSIITRFAGSAKNQRFASSVSSVGDLDNDGTDDVAFGIPMLKIGKATKAGAVAIHSGNEALDYANLITLAGTEKSALLGSAITSGDYNRDGIKDIAYSAPLADVVTLNAANKTVKLKDAGTVFVESGHSLLQTAQ